MRIFKIYCLSNFHVYNIVLLTTVTILYIKSPRSYSCYSWTFIFFDQHFHLFLILFSFGAPVTHRLFLLMVSYKSHNLSSFLFNFSSSNWIISKVLSCNPQIHFSVWCFLLLMLTIALSFFLIALSFFSSSISLNYSHFFIKVILFAHCVFL